MAKCTEYGERLKDMTLQEVFELGAKHLLTQNEKSALSTDDPEVELRCVYKHENGLACGASPFLKKYDIVLDEGSGLGWHGAVSGGFAYDNHQVFIYNLQDIHDKFSVEHWASELSRLGKRYGLNTDFLGEIMSPHVRRIVPSESGIHNALKNIKLKPNGLTKASCKDVEDVEDVPSFSKVDFDQSTIVEIKTDYEKLRNETCKMPKHPILPYLTQVYPTMVPNPDYKKEMEDVDKLKPCPSCRSNYLMIIENRWNDQYSYRIKCECGIEQAKHIFKSREDIADCAPQDYELYKKSIYNACIKEWNTRTDKL